MAQVNETAQAGGAADDFHLKFYFVETSDAYPTKAERFRVEVQGTISRDDGLKGRAARRTYLVADEGAAIPGQHDGYPQDFGAGDTAALSALLKKLYTSWKTDEGV